MLTIRLARAGKKHQPDYRMVVMEHYLPTNGKYVEKLGNYNPKSKKIVLNQEKAIEWMDKGAKPSNMVAKLMTKLEMKHPLIVIKNFIARPAKSSEKSVESSEPIAESSIKNLDSAQGKQGIEEDEEKIDKKESSGEGVENSEMRVESSEDKADDKENKEEQKSDK